LNKLLHYIRAAIGPVATAAAQFLLSLQLLHILSPVSFGSFSFLMVASQFSAGLWSALFCAPLPVLLAQGGLVEREAIRRCLFVTNLVVAILAFFIFWAAGLGLGLTQAEALVFACYAMVALLRWFARAYAYADASPVKTMLSDIVYSVSLLISIYLISIYKITDLIVPYAALALSAVLSLIPFGRRYIAQQFFHISFKDLAPYVDVWKRHSAWSLLGVLTTEATANSHAYILTFFVGPGAFAPIAASALMIRPIGVAMNALTEFERPQIARQIGKGDMGAPYAGLGSDSDSSGHSGLEGPTSGFSIDL
jgi:hypothetical protein